MAILGIGTDILCLSRLVSLVKRRSMERFATRILSEQEHEQWRSLGSSKEQQRFLAVRSELEPLLAMKLLIVYGPDGVSKKLPTKLCSPGWN